MTWAGCLQQLAQVQGAGAVGAALVRRDGVAVVSSSRRPVPEDAFSAMVAALFGAAEAAAAEWSEAPPQRVTVETPRVQVVVQPVDAEHLLVAVVPVDRPAAAVAAMAAVSPRLARELLH